MDETRSRIGLVDLTGNHCSGCTFKGIATEHSCWPLTI